MALLWRLSRSDRMRQSTRLLMLASSALNFLWDYLQRFVAPCIKGKPKYLLALPLAQIFKELLETLQ